jgi:F0F1-type ATP synthase membrane subunit c/vacuolar-type H+-ATPase subunit K
MLCVGSIAVIAAWIATTQILDLNYTTQMVTMGLAGFLSPLFTQYFSAGLIARKGMELTPQTTKKGNKLIATMLLVTILSTALLVVALAITINEENKSPPGGRLGEFTKEFNAAKQALSQIKRKPNNRQESFRLQTAVKIIELDRVNPENAIDFIEKIPAEEIKSLNESGDSLAMVLGSFSGDSISQKTVSFLIERGAPTFPPPEKDGLADEPAASIEHTKKMIIADPQKQEHNANYLHLIAASQGDEELLDWYIKSIPEKWTRDNVNQLDDFGLAPMHYAAERSPWLIKQLISIGAEINLKSTDGYTPEELAEKQDNSISLRILNEINNNPENSQ